MLAPLCFVPLLEKRNIDISDDFGGHAPCGRVCLAIRIFLLSRKLLNFLGYFLFDLAYKRTKILGRLFYKSMHYGVMVVWTCPFRIFNKIETIQRKLVVFLWRDYMLKSRNGNLDVSEHELDSIRLL